MTGRVKGKFALVTGAASGGGAADIHQFAKEQDAELPSELAAG